MNTQLFYFSGTGNSLYVAQTLQKHISNCDILPMIGSLKQRPVVVTSQRVGFVFPMHFMGVPIIVKEFLEELNLLNPEYVFVIITGANPKYGNAISVLKKSLYKKKVKLNAGYFLPMVASHFPYLKFSKEGVPTILYQKAQEMLLTIIDSVNQLSNALDYEWTFLGHMKQAVSQQEAGNGKCFSVGEGCIRCGYCMQVCPFQNIRLYGKKVEWLDNCHRCFACLHFCSKSVIQYKKLSEGKPRNHHPSITLNDISLQRG